MSARSGVLRPLESLVEPGGASRHGCVIVALCAQWCGTCREFERVMACLAADHPEHTFVWADIEDAAERVGDIEVENFPTLAIYAGGKPMYFGAVLPQATVVEQLVRALAAGHPLSAIPTEVEALGTALRLG